MIAISETHLSDSIDDCEVFIDTFVTLRNDRHIGGRFGGGVLIYATSSLNPVQIKINYHNLECMFIQVTLLNKRIIFGVVYKPPGQNVRAVDNFVNYFSDILENLYSLNIPIIIIMGDFNDRTDDWLGVHQTVNLGLSFMI